MKKKLKFSLIHLSISILIAFIVFFIVFHFIYPPPFGNMLNVYSLFGLIVGVDVVLGPLLTFLVYKSSKSLKEKVFDFFLIGLIQICALSYGLFTLYIVRPVAIGFEGDRFRLVQAVDLVKPKLINDKNMLLGPRAYGVQPVAVKMYDSDSPEYLRSIKDALSGIHPAFKLERWMPYSEAFQSVAEASQPINQLSYNNTDARVVNSWLSVHGYSEAELAYLPLSTPDFSDWIVIINRHDAKVVGYLPVDGW